MSDDADQPSSGSRKAASGAARTIPAWGAVIGGAIATYRGATGDLDAIFLVIGPALVVLGIIGFVVFRWMAARGR